MFFAARFVDHGKELPTSATCAPVQLFGPAQQPDRPDPTAACGHRRCLHRVPEEEDTRELDSANPLAVSHQLTNTNVPLEAQCDGKHPVCTICEKRGGECFYEKSESGSSSSGNDGESLIEAITLLNAMPPEDALRALSRLKNESDSSAALSRLRYGAGNIPRQPSGLAAVSGTAQRPSVAIELEIRHPFTYPSVLPVDIGDADSPFQRLLESNPGNIRPNP